MDKQNYNQLNQSSQSNGGFSNSTYNSQYYHEDYDKTEVQFNPNSADKNLEKYFSSSKNHLEEKTMTTETYRRLNYYTDPSGSNSFTSSPNYYDRASVSNDFTQQTNYFSDFRTQNQTNIFEDLSQNHYANNPDSFFYESDSNTDYYGDQYSYYEEPTVYFAPNDTAKQIDTKTKKKKLRIAIISASVLLLGLLTTIGIMIKNNSAQKNEIIIEEKHYWPSKCVGSDGSTLYFYKDGTYAWYMDEANSTDVNMGTYTVVFGNDAKQKLITDLSEYGVTSEEIDNMHTNSEDDFYQLENLTVLILTTQSLIIDGKEQLEYPYTTPYFGHSNTVFYDCANMKTANYCTFYFK